MIIQFYKVKSHNKKSIMFINLVSVTYQENPSRQLLFIAPLCAPPLFRRPNRYPSPDWFSSQHVSPLDLKSQIGQLGCKTASQFILLFCFSFSVQTTFILLRWCHVIAAQQLHRVITFIPCDTCAAASCGRREYNVSKNMNTFVTKFDLKWIRSWVSATTASKVKHREVFVSVSSTQKCTSKVKTSKSSAGLGFQ